MCRARATRPRGRSLDPSVETCGRPASPGRWPTDRRRSLDVRSLATARGGVGPLVGGPGAAGPRRGRCSTSLRLAPVAAGDGRLRRAGARPLLARHVGEAEAAGRAQGNGPGKHPGDQQPLAEGVRIRPRREVDRDRVTLGVVVAIRDDPDADAGPEAVAFGIVVAIPEAKAHRARLLAQLLTQPLGVTALDDGALVVPELNDELLIGHTVLLLVHAAIGPDGRVNRGSLRPRGQGGKYERRPL